MKLGGKYYHDMRVHVVLDWLISRYFLLTVAVLLPCYIESFQLLLLCIGKKICINVYML